MRLAQLARKLSVRPSEIVDLLAQDQIFFEDGSNAKLNDDLVKRVVLHFAPERLSEMMIMQVNDVNEPEEQAETVSTPPEETQAEPKVESSDPALSIDSTETIRAPKVELAGLKVLGKIELPQPRAKEEAKEKKGPDERPKRESREKQPRRSREDKPWRNPIALQREAEAQERERQRTEALKHEKERKRAHYLSQVKNNKPPKAARIYEEAAPMPAKVAEQKPTTWVGKFLRWLNT